MNCFDLHVTPSRVDFVPPANLKNKTQKNYFDTCWRGLKYYCAPRYCVRYVKIVLVAKINDLLSWKQRIFTKT